jgi:hypothetical protein
MDIRNVAGVVGGGLAALLSGVAINLVSNHFSLSVVAAVAIFVAALLLERVAARQRAPVSHSQTDALSTSAAQPQAAPNVIRYQSADMTVLVSHVEMKALTKHWLRYSARVDIGGHDPAVGFEITEPGFIVLLDRHGVALDHLECRIHGPDEPATRGIQVWYRLLSTADTLTFELRRRRAYLRARQVKIILHISRLRLQPDLEWEVDHEYPTLTVGPVGLKRVRWFGRL